MRLGHARRKFFDLARINKARETAKLNDVDPQAWADVLARLQDHPAKRIDEFA